MQVPSYSPSKSALQAYLSASLHTRRHLKAEASSLLLHNYPPFLTPNVPILTRSLAKQTVAIRIEELLNRESLKYRHLSVTKSGETPRSSYQSSPKTEMLRVSTSKNTSNRESSRRSYNGPLSSTDKSILRIYENPPVFSFTPRHLKGPIKVKSVVKEYCKRSTLRRASQPISRQSRTRKDFSPVLSRLNGTKEG
jgi:hypothetical protein